VSSKQSLDKAIAAAKARRDVVIKGVVHAALSLVDLSFDKLSSEQWYNGHVAKTQGTINLHDATLSSPLDFFVMLTSTESVWAPPTQSSYIAATSFQEAFARYRQDLGLPASAVAYGLVADVASDFKDGSFGTEDMYTRNQALVTTEWQVLATLEPAFLNQPLSTPPREFLSIGRWPGISHDPRSSANYFTCLDPSSLAALYANSNSKPRWHSDGRASGILRSVQDAIRESRGAEDDGAGNTGSESATARLRSAFDEAIDRGETDPEERTNTVKLVTDGIVDIIAEMLFIDSRNVNPDRSVASHGVDSLIAAELRHWFLQALRVKLQTLTLLDSQTSIKTLAEGIVSDALQSKG
jgi:acyl carrier protein